MNIVKTYQFDVIVTGGGPAGIGAAVASARTGAKTALVERYGILGGMLTSGHVQPILGDVAPGSFYDEVVALLNVGHENAPKHTTYIGREIHLDLEEAKGRLLKLVHDAGVQIFLQSPVVDVVKDGNRVTGVIVGPPMGLVQMNAGAVVDATGDGFTATMAGAEVKIGRDDGHCQPTTLEFTIDNVDESVAITCGGSSDPVTLPDGTKYSPFCREAEARGELPKNVTIVRLHRTFEAGERSVNATQANGYNMLSPEGIEGAELELRDQIEKIMAFLHKNVPGYENCRLKSTPTSTGVRETRRVMGLDMVTDHDVETGARRSDVAVHKAWFLIDIHNPTGGGQAEKYSHPAQPYDIPYGALVPAGIEGILTAGRCISGTHRAHASYRVMAICMATGQAAGTAAALSAMNRVLPSALNVKLLQDSLSKQGCTLFDQE